MVTERNECKNAGRQMMTGFEKRKHRRLAVELDLSCRKITPPAEQTYTGRTYNVSPGGLYFETTTEAFKPGNMLQVELSIPPTAGLLEFGGRISGFAKVLRTNNTRTDTNLAADRYGVALEFCRSPKLCT
jgi:hypothetical protein